MPSADRLFSATLLLPIALTLTGCQRTSSAGVPVAAPVEGPTAPATATGKFAYVGDQGGTLSGYTVSASTGALVPLAGFPIKLGLSPTAVAHDPTNHFLIAADVSSSQLHLLAIDSVSGALIEMPASPVSTVQEPVSIGFDPSGAHLYVASMGGAAVGAFSVGAAGTLTPIPGQPFPTGNTGLQNSSIGAASLAINSAGTILYLIDLAHLYAYSIAPVSGVLTLMQTIPGPTAGEGLALDPAGQFLYAVGSGPILSYAVQPNTGVLSLAVQSPQLEQSSAYTLTVAPNGQAAYTIEANNDLVTYTLKNGAFTPVGPVYASIYGEQIGIDPSGNFLYVPQACSNCPSGVYNVIHGFSVSSGGTLTPLATGSAPAGVTPWGITITS